MCIIATNYYHDCTTFAAHAYYLQVIVNMVGKDLLQITFLEPPAKTIQIQ